MTLENKTKSPLHPRNKYKGTYNFTELISAFPDIKKHIIKNKFNADTINFSKLESVKALNTALLFSQYNIEFWDIPEGYLCPPIPGRADYIHYIADLLAQTKSNERVRVLDIGVGANCIYPIIGSKEYNWNFVGCDTDNVAIESAQKIIEKNSSLTKKVELRLQTNGENILRGIIKVGERFDVAICNPPFHNSPEAALAGSQRKIKNLHGIKPSKPNLNFGGKNHELWCEGGEVGLIMRMIGESARFSENCKWFTCLVSKKDNLPPLYRKLKRVGATNVSTIEMGQGSKISRILAWNFDD